MTALTMDRPWTPPKIRRAAVVRHLTAWADLINAVAAVLRPLVVTAAVLTAATTSSGRAHADASNDPIVDGITDAGVTTSLVNGDMPGPPVRHRR